MKIITFPIKSFELQVSFHRNVHTENKRTKMNTSVTVHMARVQGHLDTFIQTPYRHHTDTRGSYTSDLKLTEDYREQYSFCTSP